MSQHSESSHWAANGRQETNVVELPVVPVLYRSFELEPELTRGVQIPQSTLQECPVYRGVALFPEEPEPASPTLPKFKRPDFWTGFDKALPPLAMPQLPTVPRLQIVAMPPYVEQYTSFIISQAAYDVLEAICTYFNSMPTSVDYVKSRTKPKISGVVYQNSGSCQFKIKIYYRDAQSNVVEFQRRSGDVIEFSRFYSTTLAALGPIVTRPYVTPTLNMASSTPAPLRPKPMVYAADPSPFLPVVLDDAMLQCLFEMLNSTEADVQRESLGCLAQALHQPSNPRKLLSNPEQWSKFMAQCTPLLCSKDKEMVRYITTILSHLAPHEAAHSELLNISDRLLHLLDLNVSADSVNAILFKEVRRQVAVTLVHLTSSHPTFFLKDATKTVTPIRRQLNLTSDSILRDHLTQCCRNLNVSECE